MSHETVLLSTLNNIFDDKYEIDFSYTLLSKFLNILDFIKGYLSQNSELFRSLVAYFVFWERLKS